MEKNKLQALIYLLDDPDRTVFELVEKELENELVIIFGKNVGEDQD